MTATPKVPQKKLRVLIADDVQETRRSTRLMLAINPDVEVVAIASNGDEAVELATHHKPDIVIMDINMPKMDGLSAYQKMLEKLPNLACIIMSTERQSSTLRNAMSIGAREYLLKPFSVDELNMAVHRIGKIVRRSQQASAQGQQLRKQREAHLKRLAYEYAKTHRADDKAMEVFELLAKNPQCEMRWLMNLAIVYVVRKQWGKLKVLAARLEWQEKQKK